MIYVMNPYLLSDINYCDPVMAICMVINGGHLDYKNPVIVDMLPLEVSYNTYSISNILSLVDVSIQFRLTMDTNNKPAIFIHTSPNTVLNIFQFHEGLHYFDAYAP